MKTALEAAITDDAHRLVVEVCDPPPWLARDLGKLWHCLRAMDCRLELVTPDVPFVVTS